MIRSFEQQLSAWVTSIAGEVLPLFGTPDVKVTVTQLVPSPEHRDLGPPPALDDDVTHLLADVMIVVTGPDTPAVGLTVVPPGATVHQMDLLSLTVIARLRERTAPGADGPAQFHGGFHGTVTAQAGNRLAQLSWDAVEANDPIVATSRIGKRQWRLALRAKLEYRLSALPIDGGRIRNITLYTDFVPADRLPLAYFLGMDSYLLARLAHIGITRISDLALQDPVALANTLSITDHKVREGIKVVVTVATTRRNFGSPVHFTDSISEVLWLPARALLRPTSGEATILARAEANPLSAAAIAILGLGTASILRPELQESILVGRLLAQERTP